MSFKYNENSMTYNVLADYIEMLAARGCGATQLVALERLMREFGGFRISSIDQHLLGLYTKGRDVSPSTIRREFTALLAAFHYAVKTRALDPRHVPYIPLPPEAAPRDRWLTEEQENEFHALAMGLSAGKPRLDPITLFVAIALDTGARKSAILGLTWNRILTYPTMTIDFRERGNAAPKNKRRVVVPIANRLLPTLERAARDAQKYGGHGKGYVSLTEPRLFPANMDFQKRFSRWVKTTPYSWVTPHVMRHTMATRLLQNGVSIWLTAGILGDTPATVVRVYGHHAVENQRAAINGSRT